MLFVWVQNQDRMKRSPIDSRKLRRDVQRKGCRRIARCLIVQEELRRKGSRYGGLDERSCESDFSDHE